MITIPEAVELVVVALAAGVAVALMFEYAKGGNS